MGGKESSPEVKIPIAIGAEKILYKKNLIILLNASDEIIALYKITGNGQTVLLTGKEADEALKKARKKSKNNFGLSQGA